ncbi:MAG: Flp family type IVb pilin [Acidobacteriota bacterium]|nr:Flp family type IVb pilin [Acidobacteriota bacterium]
MSTKAGRDWISARYIKTAWIFRAPLSEEGQDLIEYAILAALISLAAISSMKGVAAAITHAYTMIGIHLGTYTS